MTNLNKKYIDRKRFLIWGTALISGIGLMKFWNLTSKKKPETSKFLTQDGQLVEVDKKHTETRGTKIYTSELKDWIKK